METISKSDEVGSPITAQSNEGNGKSAGIVSERELKMLSLKFICERQGKYLFRQPLDPLRIVTMDLQQYEEWYSLRRRYCPVIDAETANAALRVREMSRQFERVNGTTAEQFLAEVGI